MHDRFIGVIGSKDCDDEVADIARDVGRRIAEAGFGLVCGGLGGVMEAACRGAAEAGGLTVGILPGDDPSAANSFVRVPIATGMSVARNVIIVRSAAAVVAVSGGPGTLSEIAFCLQLGVPVFSLRSHDVSPDVPQLDSPAEAVDAAVAAARSR